jgi:hypothetical protein
MTKRVEVKAELTAEALHEKYRKAKDPVERTRWHILWLVKEGHAPGKVAEQLSLQPDGCEWLYTVGMRQEARGSQTIDGACQQAELVEVLQKPPRDGVLLSGPKVVVWMQEQLGRPVSARRGWDYLQRLGYSSWEPGPQHVKADEQEQEAFKKLPEEVEAIPQAYPEAHIQLWSGNEHRIGLKPILRHRGSPRNCRQSRHGSALSVDVYVCLCAS